MNRLETELQRLYRSSEEAQRERGPSDSVRVLVLDVALPAAWEALARVWRGVQADLDWPAPAIAVSGIDSFQLWFSLAEPMGAAPAAALLESLRQRYLADVARARVRFNALAPGDFPPLQREADRWSAFLAPDLAALFADEPWLDLPPGPDAQADLLCRLESVKPDAVARALKPLRPETTMEPTTTASSTSSAEAHGQDHPRRFLLDIMRDPTVELHLRIEAAKALLPYFPEP